MTLVQRLEANDSSRPSGSRRGGTGAVFKPLERIGQIPSRWQDITPTASGPEFQKPNIEIRNNFKETEMHTSLFALIREQLETLAEESA
jgi:hypothetical protein